MWSSGACFARGRAWSRAARLSDWMRHWHKRRKDTALEKPAAARLRSTTAQEMAAGWAWWLALDALR